MPCRQQYRITWSFEANHLTNDKRLIDMVIDDGPILMNITQTAFLFRDASWHD